MKKKIKQNQEDLALEFYEAIKDLAEHPVVLEMKNYFHHGETDCYQHCMNVAYHNFYICKKFGLDARSAARAGMIHDLFLYDWHEHAELTGDHFHAMTHPKKALENAEEHFELNELEKECILKHMWPLTVIPPVSWEALIIGMTDKYCGSCEVADFYSYKMIPEGLKLPF